VKLSSLEGLDIGLSAVPVVPRRGEGFGMVLSSRDLLLTVELAVGAYALPPAGVRVVVLVVDLVDF